MKITITSTHVEEKKWQKGERSGVIRTQEAQAENAFFRRGIRLDLGKEEPHPVGEYNMDAEEAIDVGDFGDFKIKRRPKLHPINKAAPKAP